eukprot:scaffold5397_cov126-Skeletonema_marinoi.AAC.10
MARRKNKSRRSSSSADNGGGFGKRVSIQPSSNNSGSNNVFQMDRILCRAYSLDSNISDLSGSIGGHRPRGTSNAAPTREDENIFMSILNDCATLTGIAEFVAEGQAALTGTDPDDEKKSKRSSRKKLTQPNVWGVSPSVDGDSSDDSAKLRKKLEKAEEEIQHENIELVLDDNFKTSADNKSSSPRPKLKNRVSSVLRRPSPAADGENVSPTNNEFGPSLLDESGDAQDSEEKTSDPVPINQANSFGAATEAGSTASSQKKSSRKLFRFPLNPAKKNKSTKKKSSPSKAIANQPTSEQIEEAKMWKSTLDKKTGRAYYYNSKTKQTVWEKPIGYDEACEELAREKEEGASDLWKATVDSSTGKTYYYNKTTKEVSWTIPKGYKGSVRGDKKAKSVGDKAEFDGSDIAKYWRETVDANTGKTYYFNKKTKEVSWEKPAGFSAASAKKSDGIADAETVPLSKSQSAPAKSDYDTPFDEEPPDAPFDEPDGAPASPRRAHFGANGNADETPDAMSSMSLYSRTKSLKSIELTKQRTYASAMTDTTRKATNTAMPARDFTNTQINVIRDDEDEERSQTPKIAPQRGQTTPTKSSTLSRGKAPVVSPSSPKRRYRTKKAENLGSDDDSDFDDWSDEVSELSGIGNEVNGVKTNRSKAPKDSRTESSSQRDTAALDNPERKEDPKDWSKEQLDSFISKNDWGQVAKYIAESRKTATTGAVPQMKVGGMTNMQQGTASKVSSDDDSVWQSLDDASNANPEDKDASFDYDKVAARQPVSAVQ